MNGIIKLDKERKLKKKNFKNKLILLLKWKNNKQENWQDYKYSIAKNDKPLRRITLIKFI